VRPQTNTWRCFGCNKSGTAFDWLMEREHLDLLVREYRLLRQRQGRRGGKSAGKPAQ